MTTNKQLFDDALELLIEGFRSMTKEQAKEKLDLLKEELSKAKGERKQYLEKEIMEIERRLLPF